MQEEHYGDKLKWEAAESAFKGRIEELQEAAEEQQKELLRTQKGKQEDMALLLDGFLEEDDADEEESTEAAPSAKTLNQVEKLRQVAKNAMDEAQTAREQMEILKEELAAAQRIMSSKKGGGGGVKNKLVKRQHLKDDDFMESDTDGEFDNPRDPDWICSADKYRKKGSKDTTVDTSSTSVGDVSSAINVSSAVNNSTGSKSGGAEVHCNCKTDCSKRNCGCRKNSVFCSKKCRCQGCSNKDRDSVSDDQEGGAAAIKKEQPVSGDDDEEEAQDSKRIK